jgi:hypothetical protein
MSNVQTESVERTDKPSFFIPRIDFQFTKTNIKDIFEKLTGGVVSRVDFVSFNSEKGVGRRAYVHFEKWVPQIETMYSLIEQVGNIETTLRVSDGSLSGLVQILINTNPVPETTLNLNQLASNVEFLADQIKNQQSLIESQQNIIENQQQMLCMMEQRMNQLSMCIMPMPPPMPMPPMSCPSPIYFVPNNGMNVQYLPPPPPTLYRKM